ncbi:sugar phosphate isomerase/epimerase family protein [Pseudarthrobacter sp. NPDC055928]|uniref:sugar phosphate isomerase/epimerase family protein n=1 Tax=Pseudarthrobacter sp. NPDC055928 TaxID=3345661 RepID=UPI0035D547C2
MKIGIDGYCYHRFFGEVYPGLEEEPGHRMTVSDLIQAASAAGAEALSIEHFMLAPGEDLEPLRAQLQDAPLDLMWAWGHPDGLGSGQRPEELSSLKKHVEIAAYMGAEVMRICGGGRRTRLDVWDDHRRGLLPLLREATDYAEDRGVILALENHLDFTSDQIIEIVAEVGSDHLGICLDTTNQLRMLEEPQLAIRKMAPYAKACHFKDARPHLGDPQTFAFWPSVPVGDGIIDFPDALAALDESGFDGILALEIDYLHPEYPSLDEAIYLSIERMQTLVAGYRDPYLKTLKA